MQVTWSEVAGRGQGDTNWVGAWEGETAGHVHWAGSSKGCYLGTSDSPTYMDPSGSLTQQLGADKILTRRLWLHGLGREKERRVMGMERACGQSGPAVKPMASCRLVFEVASGHGAGVCCRLSP